MESSGCLQPSSLPVGNQTTNRCAAPKLKMALWRAAGRTELESIMLALWASRRRQDLLDQL